MIGESFMPIGPRAEAELQEKRSKYQFWLHPWTSAAAHNAFSKITVSLKQAQGTRRFFKDSAQKQFTRLRKTAQKCYEQYIKSVFVSFWAPYVLLRSNFDSKC